MVSAEEEKPQIEWLGQAGFRIKSTHEGVTRVIYIDTWLGCPKTPDTLKDESGKVVTPTDADLVLVTHGHFDHASSAVEIAQASTKEGGCKIGCIYELGQIFN